MKSRIRTHKKRPKEQTQEFLTAPAQPMFQSRPFVVQTQQAEQSQQPDLKRALQRAERYGHRIKRLERGQGSQNRENPQVVQRVPGTITGSRKLPFFKTGNTRPGTKWNEYKTLSNLEMGTVTTTENSSQVGHEFPIIFTFDRIANKENKQFNPVPKLIWEEHIVETKDGTTHDRGWVNKYDEKPNSNTFQMWNLWWQNPDGQNNGRAYVYDTPKLGRGQGGDRTVTREIRFRIGIEGDAQRVEFRQIIELQAGQVIRNQLDRL